MSSIRIRPWLILVHRWIGLLSAFWLFILGLTGSILVYYEELDRLLNPELRSVAVSAEHLSTSEIFAAAEAHRPGSYGLQLRFGPGPNDATTVLLGARPGHDAVSDNTRIFVDPYTGEVLGERVFGAFQVDRKHLVNLIYQIHVDLKLGKWMQWILGLIALSWIFSQIAGIFVSFHPPKLWKRSFWIRRRAKGYVFLFDLHRSTGLWFLPATLVLAVTGLYFNWYELVEDSVAAVAEVSPRTDESTQLLPSPLYDPSVSIDSAMSTARMVTGGAKIERVRRIPEKGLYWIYSKDPRDVGKNGMRWTFIDMQTGAVLSNRHALEGSAGNAFLAWQPPLHSGHAFGWPGRLYVFFAGLIVAAASVTGIVIWLRKRIPRVSRRRRAQQI